MDSKIWSAAFFSLSFFLNSSVFAGSCAYRTNVFHDRVCVYKQPQATPAWNDEILGHSVQSIRDALQNVSLIGVTAEQLRAQEVEWIKKNCDNSTLLAAQKIAAEYGVSIVLRPTPMVGNSKRDLGFPTKPVEIKNKTSKELDSILEPEISSDKVGAVVHYLPRLLWSNQTMACGNSDYNWFWQEKIAELRTQSPAIPNLEAKEESLKKLFFLRVNEYCEENPFYLPGGKFANYVEVRTPFLYMKDDFGRPILKNIYGDNDIFAFANETDQAEDIQFQENEVVKKSENAPSLLTALMLDPDVESQHGGVYYWQPDTVFNQNIKDVILNSHKASSGGEPLLVIDKMGVKAFFYYDGNNQRRLKSVWSRYGICSTAWRGRDDVPESLCSRGK